MTPTLVCLILIQTKIKFTKNAFVQIDFNSPDLNTTNFLEKINHFQPNTVSLYDNVVGLHLKSQLYQYISKYDWKKRGKSSTYRAHITQYDTVEVQSTYQVSLFPVSTQ